ncbi:MAG: hypothetical protein ACYTFY_04680 [Planctomycetota bacterium]|jgi:hypothetical protein
MNIKYPPALAMKSIKNEGIGGDFAGVDITVPTIVRPGKEFAVKVALIDKNGFAVIDYREELAVKLPELNIECKVTFQKDQPALAEIGGIEVEKEGLYRFECTAAGNTFYSNPLYCSKSFDSDIYWGDPHIHTALSNCCVNFSRSCTFSFIAARYLSCLDWAGAADHVSNGRCELARWKEEAAISDLYNDEPDFATLPAYEASLSGGSGGDNNVYMSEFPSMFVDEHGDGNTITMCEKLDEMAKEEGFDYFLVPHHTTRTGKHGEISDEIYPADNLMPLVEIHSKWGTSEYRGNPMALHKIHEGPSYAVDLLERGLAFGFVGGTDTHGSLTFCHGEGIEPSHIDRPAGITAVRCSSLTRKDIFNEMRNKNCYAAAGERIFLDVRINNTAMGQFSKKNGDREIVIKAAGRSDIESVEIMRNGKPFKTWTPDSWSFEETITDTESFADICLDSKHLGNFIYYYVRVRCTAGTAAWSSPIWITE